MTGLDSGMSTPSTPLEQRPVGNLSDGFASYQRIADRPEPWSIEEQLVYVRPDALLSLYTSSKTRRQALLRALHFASEQLYLPHAAAESFWRQRLSLLNHHRDRVAAATKEIEELHQRLLAASDQWKGEYPTEGRPIDGTILRMSAAIDQLTEQMERIASDSSPIVDADGTDVVLSELEVVFESRVEQLALEAESPSPTALVSLNTDALYGPEAEWLPVTQAAIARGRNVTVVSGQFDGFWLAPEPAPRCTAHPDRVRELRSSVRASITLMSLENFLELTLAMEGGANEDRTKLGAENEYSAGWSYTSIQRLLRRLELDGPVQANAIKSASASDGLVTRSKIFELGDYEPDRTLKGFTRPIARVTRDLVRGGLLGEDAEDILSPVYEGSQAAGFRVPTSILPLVREVLEQGA